jgi:hypothetical protein
MTIAPRHKCVPHPHVEGAYTIEPFRDGFIPIIASKAMAEALATQRNGLDVAKGVQSVA